MEFTPISILLLTVLGAMIIFCGKGMMSSSGGCCGATENKQCSSQDKKHSSNIVDHSNGSSGKTESFQSQIAIIENENRHLQEQIKELKKQ